MPIPNLPDPTDNAEIDRLFQNVVWESVPPPADPVAPHVTHKGRMELFGAPVYAFILSDGRRIMQEWPELDLTTLDDEAA